MTEPAQIAEQLTDRMKVCMLSASPTDGGNLQIWASRPTTIKAVCKLELGTNLTWDGTTELTPLGLAVRAILQAQEGK